MKKAQRERVYRNVYRVFAVVLGLSALLLFMMNVQPFGFGIAWSTHDMVFTRTSALSDIGDTVAKNGVVAGEAMLYTVQEVFRQDGELQYRVVASNDGAEALVAARDARKAVLASVPVLGLWSRALSHPIGVLALIGIPLFTFALDIVIVAWAGNTRTQFTSFLSRMKERSATSRERKERERLVQEEAYEQYEPEVPAVQYREEPQPQPILRTRPETYGMTIRLTRPQRYGMNTR